MHGLMNRTFQNFVTDVYGRDVWLDATRDADLDFDEFEAMLLYDDAVSVAVIGAICRRLKKSRSLLLEDLGTYLVSHPNTWRIRRLLRFGGADLTDFIESLEDLADRARLAVPDLTLPRVQVDPVKDICARYTLTCDPRFPGMEYVALGCLRAIADDYGALAVVELEGESGPVTGPRRIGVSLLSTSFAAGNSFDLARQGA